MKQVTGDVAPLSYHECGLIRMVVSNTHGVSQERVLRQQSVLSVATKLGLMTLIASSPTSGSLGNYVPKNSAHSFSRNRWQRHERHCGSAPHLRLQSYGF